MLGGCHAAARRPPPAARLAVLPDCGHFSSLEQPDRVYAAIKAFLAPS